MRGWSRSGTACRSSPRSGTGARASSSSTTSTPRCGGWCCPAVAGPDRGHRRAPAGARRSTGAAGWSPSPSPRRTRSSTCSASPPTGCRWPRRGSSPGSPRRGHGRRLAAGGGRRAAGAGQALRPAHRGRWSEARASRPDLRAVIVGEGYERPGTRGACAAALGAEEWLELPGRLGDDELLDWYRRAWVVASTSLREGWGMTLTEAAACGTPAVATDIAGHRDAVVDGGHRAVGRRARRVGAGARPSWSTTSCGRGWAQGALERARWFTWDATAREHPRGPGGRGRRPADRWRPPPGPPSDGRGPVTRRSVNGGPPVAAARRSDGAVAGHHRPRGGTTGAYAVAAAPRTEAGRRSRVDGGR